MKCTRCQGLMIEGQFMDLEEAYGFMWTTSWRCVNCGHVSDFVIAHNRLARHELTYQDDEVHLGAEACNNRLAA